MSEGDTTDLSMSPSCSGEFSMSPPTPRKILRDRWGGAAAGPARGLARRRLLPTCPSLPQGGIIGRQKGVAFKSNLTVYTRPHDPTRPPVFLDCQNIKAIDPRDAPAFTAWPGPRGADRLRV